MTGLTSTLAPMLFASSEQATGYPIAHAATGLGWAGWILWLPIISLVLCGLCAALRVRSKAPAWITVALLGGSFLVTLALYFKYTEPVTIELFRWFDIAAGDGSFTAAFALYVDRLSLLWMLFVTGLSMLIALYASEYMEADVGKGYARFFAGVSVFVFAMSALVLGDNLVMLYLGWEGVGFASYWLIGYYYQKPSAVAAAKKAFIVNRIGDLGLALGIYLTWQAFGTVEYTALFTALESGQHAEQAGGWAITAIPFLFMLGAFGKSAQLPLYVWLPDAMEGPTPVSALIHAATMVTAGVYLLARMFPLLELHPAALPTIAWIGALTALLAATIGMAQYDIKRIMAYSTVSQLGYMFVGIGVMTTYGAVYHVFTHAFFKAVLFLTCGAIMHGFAGQLDLRKLSGLRHMAGWRITSYTMLFACFNLIGLPYVTAGFKSKDEIIAQSFASGLLVVGVITLVTAVLTAYYTFRVWFRVCAGPERYELGSDHHGDEADDDHGHAAPHPPRLAINVVLVVITAGSIGAMFLSGWASGMVDGSTARDAPPHAEGGGWWANPHHWVPIVAGIAVALGLGLAWYYHLARRSAADELRARLLASPATAWLPTAMENKWYVDEIYDALLRMPLWVGSYALAFLDKYLVDVVIVDGIARVPRWLGRAFQPLQNGVLQSYAVSMAGGVGLVAILVIYMPEIINFLNGWLSGGGGG